MNATDFMAVDPEQHDQLFIPPRTVRDALRKYADWRHFAAPNSWPPESPLFAVLHAPGRATNGAQDGGMAERIDSMGRAIARYAMMLEIRSAIVILPPDLHRVVVATYEVPQRERPRSDRVVAEMLGITRLETIRLLERAYGYLARHLSLTQI